MAATKTRRLFWLATGLFWLATGLALAVPALFLRGADPDPRPGAGIAQAADPGWPLFRGNARQTGVAAAPLSEDLNVRWKFKAGDGIESTPAVAGDMVFIGAFDDHLHAIDLASGKERWKYKCGPIKAPASVHKGAVYVGDADGKFHCVDAATGKKRWAFDTEAEITSGANFAGDTVLFGAYDETLYCLTLDGKRVWKFNIAGGPVLGSPAVVGQTTFASGCDSMLHIIDAEKGKELGSVNLGGQTGATVAVVGDQLYVGTMTNKMLAIDVKKQEVLWRFQAPKAPQPFFASAAVTDEWVVVGSRDKRVHALERKTGREVWSFLTGGKVDSSPVIAGNRVVVGSYDGNLYVLDLAKGTELKKYPLGSPVVGSPAVAGNALVIGTQDGQLYCFEAKK